MPAEADSQARAQRALSLLALPHAQMVATKSGFAIYRNDDRRRRPVMEVQRSIGQAWIAQGLVLAAGANSFCLATRIAAPPRPPADPVGDASPAKPARRAFSPAGLSDDEAAALERLAADLEAAEIGVLRGVDWAAPAQARALRPHHDPLAAGAAARGRAKRALAALAPPLAMAARAVCTEAVTLEALERRFQWPARSGRLAITLAAAQLAHHYRFAAPCGP